MHSSTFWNCLGESFFLACQAVVRANCCGCCNRGNQANRANLQKFYIDYILYILFSNFEQYFLKTEMKLRKKFKVVDN